jgi:hypothetical protein
MGRGKKQARCARQVSRQWRAYKGHATELQRLAWPLSPGAPAVRRKLHEHPRSLGTRSGPMIQCFGCDQGAKPEATLGNLCLIKSLSALSAIRG